MALVLAVLAVIWLSHKNELETQRNTLIADVLWLEQDLRFRFGRDQEQLQRLALELGQNVHNQALFRLHAGHFLKSSPELVQVLVLAPNQRPLYGLPSAIAPQSGEQAPLNLDNAFDQARRMGKTVYAPPYLNTLNTGQFLSLHPLFNNDGFAGMLVAVYEIQRLLADAVPWWFAQKYQVRISDDAGVLFATKSNIEGVPEHNLSHDIILEPPGHGTRLSVQAYPEANNTPLNLLTGIVLILALAVLISLGILRQQMRRRIKTEQALRAEYAFRKAMEDSLTVGMRARDLTGKIIYVNAAFCHMTGFEREELEGCTPPLPYWAPENMEEALARHKEVLAGEASPQGFEIRLMKKSGERFEALIFEAPLIDGDGRHTGWMASLVDITERNKAEALYRQQQEQLQFTSRLVTMGEMASTLAHELNQPLSAISSYATGCLNLIQSGQTSLTALRDPLSKLVAQAQRAGQIIRRVHDFVRRREPRRETCDLNAILEDALGLVEAAARAAGVRIHLLMAEALPPLRADRLMLEQLALNLIKNSLEAMKDTPAGERQLTLQTQQDAHSLLLTVSDSGSGITPDLADKLFTPFLSTKEEGMGMGLNICRSIAELHHGRLWFEPGAQGGTVFYLSLPLESP